jgi:toxin ParE1/3/4
VKSVIFDADAEDELRAALEYYDQQRPGLGGELLTEVFEAVERIRQSPRLYAITDKNGTRGCPVHRFPYTLFYIELEESIWIAAVAHHRRRPRYWARRKPP